MSMFRRLADRLLPAREVRAKGDPIFAPALSGLSTANMLVNARTAENLSTVLACVTAISSAIASLPVYVYRTTEGGREVDEAHPLMRLIRRGPNVWQTWPDFMEWLVASTLLRGNGLAEIVADARGDLVELRPVPWEWASVQLLPSGRLAFDVTSINNVYGGTGRPRRILQDEALHVRDRTDDGLLGRSRLQRAAAVIGASLSVQEFTRAKVANGINPRGALMVDAKLADEQYAFLRDRFREAFAGPTNAAKALVLDQGIKWEKISVSPEDAELLASRRFTTEELARIYNVPPPIVGIWDHSTFTNSETAGRWFAQHCLVPWLRKLEAELRRSVFSEASRATHHVEFDLSAFLRGDPETRWKSHEIAIRNRVLTPNEVREVEGWNPREGGGDFPAAAAAPRPEAA